VDVKKGNFMERGSLHQISTNENEETSAQDMRHVKKLMRE
jgi:hypothetical protein